jgi:hypothetical protein
MTVIAGESDRRPRFRGRAITRTDAEVADGPSDERARNRRAWRLPRALRPYQLLADDIVITSVDISRDLEYGHD